MHMSKKLYKSFQDRVSERAAQIREELALDKYILKNMKKSKSIRGEFYFGKRYSGSEKEGELNTENTKNTSNTQNMKSNLQHDLSFTNLNTTEGEEEPAKNTGRQLQHLFSVKKRGAVELDELGVTNAIQLKIMKLEKEAEKLSGEIKSLREKKSFKINLLETMLKEEKDRREKRHTEYHNQIAQLNELKLRLNNDLNCMRDEILEKNDKLNNKNSENHQEKVQMLEEKLKLLNEIEYLRKKNEETELACASEMTGLEKIIKKNDELKDLIDLKGLELVSNTVENDKEEMRGVEAAILLEKSKLEKKIWFVKREIEKRELSYSQLADDKIKNIEKLKDRNKNLQLKISLTAAEHEFQEINTAYRQTREQFDGSLSGRGIGSINKGASPNLYRLKFSTIYSPSGRLGYPSQIDNNGSKEQEKKSKYDIILVEKMMKDLNKEIEENQLKLKEIGKGSSSSQRYHTGIKREIDLFLEKQKILKRKIEFIQKYIADPTSLFMSKRI